MTCFVDTSSVLGISMATYGNPPHCSNQTAQTVRLAKRQNAASKQKTHCSSPFWTHEKTPHEKGYTPPGCHTHRHLSGLNESAQLTKELRDWFPMKLRWAFRDGIENLLQGCLWKRVPCRVVSPHGTKQGLCDSDYVIVLSSLDLSRLALNSVPLPSQVMPVMRCVIWIWWY